VVIRDTASSGHVVLDRYDYMRTLSGESKAPANWALPDYAAPMPAPLNEKNTVPGNKSMVLEGESRKRAEPSTLPLKP
jgi:hypothetical protein